MTATELATLWVFIALLVFVAILIWQKVPAAIGGALDSRSARIAKDLDEARKIREEAQALLAEFQKKRIAAEREAIDIVELAKKEAATMVRDAEEKLALSIAAKSKGVDAKIAAAMLDAQAEVRTLAVDAAFAAATKILGEKVSGELASSLVSRGINDVQARMN